MDACPIHLDIPRYVELIKEARYQESLDVIRERLPIPGIVGRVCVRPCEEHCRRANMDEPISIKFLKRFVADQELAMGRAPALRRRAFGQNRPGGRCRRRTGRGDLRLSSGPSRPPGDGLRASPGARAACRPSASPITGSRARFSKGR